MKFDERYFSKFKFTQEQINRNFKNALKDLNIAKKDKIAEVKFNYGKLIRQFKIIASER